ncbi:MAG TPA: DUF6206 family protein [Spirochaetota bacterium]|nr:DUF6206 family protein [Spirochaetota bacterium]
MVDDYKDISEHLVFLNKVYELKRKRIRFMQLATVDRQLHTMADNFYSLWNKTSKGFILKDAHIHESSIDTLKGLFGLHDEITIISKGDKAILTFDKLRFYQYLVRHVANINACSYLYNIFYGEENISINTLVKEQLPYLERYIPTFKKFDKAKDITSFAFSQFDIENLWSIIEIYDRIKDNLIKDTALYKQFVNDFTRLYREDIALKILGYGEISTVMQTIHGWQIDKTLLKMQLYEPDWVWKRMPPINSFQDVEALKKAYHEYREILIQKIGIQVPEQQFRYFKNNGWYTVYAGQKKINPQMVGNVLVKRLDEVNALALFNKVLSELKRWYLFNKTDSSIQVGIDGQISNWVLLSADGALNYVGSNDTLLYIDTSTPLYRINGVEQLNAELFLKNIPWFLRSIIRALFLQEVLDRYYDLRSVVVDCIANLYKEKREDLIPACIKAANYFFSTMDESLQPLTLHEIVKYYQGDAFIWRLFQFARKVDKFVTERIFQKKYMYRLPKKIER